MFISYSRHDTLLCDALVVTLRSLGIEPFLDRNRLGAGLWEEQLRQALVDDRKPIVLVVTTDSAARSAWVAQEIRWAKEAGLTIVPLTPAEAHAGQAAIIGALGLGEYQAVELAATRGSLTAATASRLWQVLWVAPLDSAAVDWAVQAGNWSRSVLPGSRTDFWAGMWRRELLGSLQRDQSVVLTAPGGSGKSVLLARLVAHLIAEPGRSVPVVVGRDVLQSGPGAVAQLVGAPSAGVLADHVARIRGLGIDVVFVVDGIDRTALRSHRASVVPAVELLAQTGRMVGTCRPDIWDSAFKSVPARKVQLGPLPSEDVANLLEREFGRPIKVTAALRVAFFLDVVLALRTRMAGVPGTVTEILKALWRELSNPAAGAVPSGFPPRVVLARIAQQQLEQCQYEVARSELGLESSGGTCEPLDALIESGVVVEFPGPSEPSLRLRHDILDCFGMVLLLLDRSAGPERRESLYQRAGCACAWPVLSMLVQVASDTADEALLREVFERILGMTDRKRLGEEHMAAAWAATYVLRERFEQLSPMILAAMAGEPTDSLTSSDQRQASQLGPPARLTQETASTLASAFLAMSDLGSIDRTLAIATLTQGLDRWTLRRRFIDALAMFPESAARLALAALAERELAGGGDPQVLGEIAAALGRHSGDEVLPILRRIMDDPDLEIRIRRAAVRSWNAISLMDQVEVPAVGVEELLENLVVVDRQGRYSDWRVVAEYADFVRMGLAGQPTERVVDALVDALGHEQTFARTAVAACLGTVDSVAARTALTQELLRPSIPAELRTQCLAALRSQLDASPTPDIANARRWALLVAGQSASATGVPTAAELVGLALANTSGPEPIVTSGAFEVGCPGSPATTLAPWGNIGPDIDPDLPQVLRGMVTPDDWAAAGLEREPKYRLAGWARNDQGRLDPEFSRSGWTCAVALHLAMRRRFAHGRPDRCDWLLTAAEGWLAGASALPSLVSAQVAVVTSDSKVLLSERGLGTPYAPGAWSASFEEQLTSSDLGLPGDPLRAAATRGAAEEFGSWIASAIGELSVLGAFVEMPILNPGVALVMQLHASSREFQEQWKRSAPERDGEIAGIQFIDAAGDLSVALQLQGRAAHPTSCLRVGMLRRWLRSLG